jgi:hypothetical protein
MDNLYTIRITDLSDPQSVADEQDIATKLMVDRFVPVYHVLAFNDGVPYLLAVFTRSIKVEKVDVTAGLPHYGFADAYAGAGNGQPSHPGSDLPQGTDYDHSSGASAGTPSTR